VKAKKRTLSAQTKAILIGVSGFVVLLLGLFTLVLPQRSQASKLATDLETTEAQIVTARALATQKPAEPIRVADLFKLVKAMPDHTDMTGIILQLQQTATDAGVEFDSIQPQPVTTGTGFAIQPIDLSFNGNFYELTDFLFRLRSLVSVRGGALDATGRLFSVDNMEFGPGAEGGFPKITANLRINAYVYGTGATTAAVPPAATTTPTDGSTVPTDSAPTASGATG
jgi:Tfp pilus assembly protein PilO